MDTRSRKYTTNDWQSQPRDSKTGRWERRGKYPRSESLRLRLTRRERRLLELAAMAEGMTMTEWVLRAIDDALSE